MFVYTENKRPDFNWVNTKTVAKDNPKNNIATTLLEQQKNDSLGWGERRNAFTPAPVAAGSLTQGRVLLLDWTGKLISICDRVSQNRVHPRFCNFAPPLFEQTHQNEDENACAPSSKDKLVSFPYFLLRIPRPLHLFFNFSQIPILLCEALIFEHILYLPASWMTRPLEYSDISYI